MRAKIIAVAAVTLVTAGGAYVASRHRPAPLAGPGISLALATDRAARLSNLRYHLELDVPEAAAEPVIGRLAATFDLADPAAGLAFDFRQPSGQLHAVQANGHSLTAETVDGHVVIPGSALTTTGNRVELSFLAGDAPLNRSDEFLYALFVPARASQALPVFDQPDLKARWRLTLNLPAAWRAMSNGEETAREVTGDRARVEFAETQPISTYLFTFVAGRFEWDEAERDGRRYRLLHRETDADKYARNREAIFDLHAQAVAWLEDYTGIAYPFGKFDFALIPSFQFGGMEHPGAVFYNASSLLLDATATQNQQLGRASLIAHETAHMWFGDLVTMRWFNDVWMKEVFANFMAAKIVNPSFPEVNHELRFLYSHYPSAYEIDRTAGANPIRQDLANLDEAGSLYGAIIYQKAPIVMRQLELLLGADTMRDGLRSYLADHAYGNATWPDLVQALDARAPAVDLEAWSRAWVEEPGRPRIRTDLRVEDGRVARLAFDVDDPRGRGLTWPQQLEVRLGGAGDTHTFSVRLDTGRTDVAAAVGLPAPDWVLPVGEGYGYGDFVLDERTRTSLIRALPAADDPLTRGAALVALWESMLEGRVPAEDMLDLLLTSLPAESTELTVSQMLEYLRAAFWRFTPATQRDDIAPRVERVLREGLSAASTTSRKAAWFNTLRSVATTEPTVRWLESVWRRDERIPGLPLSEADEADLAFDLAVRDVADADTILAAQLERLRNPDRRARFAFVMPALAGDVDARAAFFEQLRDVDNRRRESWVLDAARYLHHPLRASQSSALVIPALALMREIQRTGDIFFPKRWADATLGGYQDADTARAVRGFLDGLPPDYPPRLRWVLLASADPLFRATR